MMMRKSKKLVMIVFVACFLLTGVLLSMLSSNKAYSADAGTWKSSPAAISAVGDTGLKRIGASTKLINETDILSMPNNTIYFQMRVNKSAAWSGLYFLNGTANWSAVDWPGSTVAGDVLPHIIFQDGGSQIYGNNIQDIYGAPAVGVSGMPTLSTSLVSVEIHIGTGEGTDLSYIKINNAQLTSEKNSTSALAYVTADKFPNGCYLGMHVNLDAASEAEIYLGEYNTPIVTSVANALKSVINMGEAQPVASDASFTVRNLADTATAVLKINGAEVDSSYYTVEPVEGDTTALKYSILKKFWKSGVRLTSASYFTVESDNGKAVVMLSILNEDPPQWSSDNFKVLENTDDGVSFDFFYGSKAYSVIEDGVNITSGIYSGNLGSAALIVDSDYTVTSLGNDEFRVTITKTCLDKLLSVYNGRFFRIKFNDHTLDASIYLRQTADGWYAREIDLVKDTTLNVNDYYTTGSVNAFSQSELVSRLYFNKAVDVTKPIFVEFQAFDSNVEWALLQIADSLKTMDYFSNDTKDEAMLQALFFGGRSDIQKFAGFAKSDSTNASYNMSTMKNIVVEIYFGKTVSEGYVKINGSDCGGLLKKQSDFKDGVAYVSWFFNNQNKALDFKFNSNVNAIAIESIVDGNLSRMDDYFVMDLAKAKDFALKLKNTDGDFTIKNERGYTLVRDTDYTYDNGILTFKAAYFTNLSFSKHSTISIWDNDSNTGTQFKMEYSTSNMGTSLLAFGTKGALEDFTFNLPQEVTSVDSVLKPDETELDSSLYSQKDGVLTIKSSAIADIAGVTEYMVISGAKLYPVYIYIDEFTEGGKLEKGNGTVDIENDTYTFNGDVSYTFMNVFSLTEGVTFRVNFSEIIDYYKGGLVQNAGFVRLRMYDPYSGFTLVYTLYANYAEGEVTATDTALYESFYMINSDGTNVLLPANRGININNSENSSALGIHGIKFFTDGDFITIAVDNARTTTISLSDVGIFNINTLVCTVEIPANTSAKENLIKVNYYNGDVDIDYDDSEPVDPDPTDPTDSPDPTDTSPDPSNGSKEEPGGCKGTAVSAGIIAVIAMALFVLLRKKGDVIKN